MFESHLSSVIEFPFLDSNKLQMFYTSDGLYCVYFKQIVVILVFGTFRIQLQCSAILDRIRGFVKS